MEKASYSIYNKHVKEIHEWLSVHFDTSKFVKRALLSNNFKNKLQKPPKIVQNLILHPAG